GARQPVAGAFALRGDGTVELRVGAYDAGRTLVVDPTLVYSTYLGGSDSDQGQAIAVDPAGNVYLTGWTRSPNFPIPSPLQPTNGGGTYDAWIAKLNAAGGLVYATYLGGSGEDQGLGLAVDASGNACVTGYTSSVNFPTVNALQSSLLGITDAFVAKLN